jgi:lipopolysaccharide transport system permease protein
METRVYQKENTRSFLKILKESLSDIYKSRFLSRQLAERDIKAQYRQSYLGIIWAFITPLATAAVWVFLNLSGTVKLTDTGIPYPVYAFSGTLLWSILVEAINSPTVSTNSSRGLLSKINFPKEALIIAGIYKLLFNSLVKILLLVVFVFLFGLGFHWSLLLLPFGILGMLLFGTMIGLFITPLGLLYKDIGKISSFGLSFLMYVTPVVYAIPEDGFMKTIMELNPLTPLILTTRDFITGSNPEFLPYFIGLILLCVPVFFVSLLLYRISIPVIVERSSA